MSWKLLERKSLGLVLEISTQDLKKQSRKKLYQQFFLGGSQVQSMPYNVNTVNKTSFCAAVRYFSKIRNVSYMESEKYICSNLELKLSLFFTYGNLQLELNCGVVCVCVFRCMRVFVTFPGKHTRMSCHFLLQGIFLTQGWNLHLLQ